MDIAFPGDTIAVLPDDGVVKVDRSIVRVGQELRCTVPGVRIQGDRQYRVKTDCKRYNVVVEQDRVLGVVTGSFSEEYRVDIKAPSGALLPTLAFEGATKRNRPMLKVGDTVFCRVTSASAYTDPELSCMNGKGLADGLGHMKGGYLFETTTGHCRKLLQQPAPLELQLIRDAVACELAVGLNGRVWVKSKDPKKTAALVRVLHACARTVDPEQIKSAIAEELNVFSSDVDMKQGK